MSENASEANVEQQTEQGAETAPEATEIDWKAKAREWEKRSKDNLAQINELRPQAEQFRALEEASKSEAQRLSEAAETAKKDAETARAEAIRYKAAAMHGIGVEHFDLLGSGTEDEISARAEKVAELLAAKAKADATTQAPPGRPVEQLRPGATPGEAESDDDVLYKKIFG